MFEYTLVDAANSLETGGEDGSILRFTQGDFGLTDGPEICVEKRYLSGGKQQGVELITVSVGDMVVRVVPTRAMAVLDVTVAGTRFGWDSPVTEVVHPMFINQEAFGGLGWLEGFNEMIVRCGYEWAGHPGMDGDQMLTLHGRIQNTPASVVKLTVEQKAPYRISLIGRVDEKRFKQADFETWMTLTMVPGENKLYVSDTLTNCSDYPKEYQAIYHNNFGSPVLEAGAQIHVPARQISPFNEAAAPGLADWNLIAAPKKDFDEQVFNVFPNGDAQGDSLALLHNAAASQGVCVGYNMAQLPVLTLWKNTDTPKQGYAVGIEPGTSFAYNRHYQRDLGLVPVLAAGESITFDVSFSFLTNPGEVEKAVHKVKDLQGEQGPELLPVPLVTVT